MPPGGKGTEALGEDVRLSAGCGLPVDDKMPIKPRIVQPSLLHSMHAADVPHCGVSARLDHR